LAQQGNGAYYDGNDPFDLPRLVLKDAQQVQRAAIVEQDVQPRPVSDTPALAGIDPSTLPQLRGYVATTPKPQASVDLVSGQLDPILSEWQYGLGRVMAWTSDADNRWSSQWVNWPDFGRFWAQVIERSARPPDDPNRQLNVSIEGSQARITLDAQTGADDPQRHYLNFLPTTATLVDPRGAPRQIALPQIAPGRYEATTPVEDDGVYQLDVQQTDPSTSASAQQSSGFVVPYSPEYAAAGIDQALLEALTARTGGQVIQDPDQALLHDLPAVGAPRPLWPYLLSLAAIVLLFDVAVRRVRFGSREAHGAYLQLRRRLGYVDEPGRLTLAPRRVTSVPAGGAVPDQVSAAAPTRAVPDVSQPSVAHDASRASRLLAARQRAVRR
jgi:Putative glutamine amidotransferase